MKIKRNNKYIKDDFDEGEQNFCRYINIGYYILYIIYYVLLAITETSNSNDINNNTKSTQEKWWESLTTIIVHLIFLTIVVFIAVKFYTLSILYSFIYYAVIFIIYLN